MGSNPLLSRINSIRAEGRIALCGYFLAGYRTPEAFYEAVRMAEKLDVVEFGIPSHHPHLDGTVIGNAHRTVIAHRGVHTETALALVGGLKHLPQPRFVRICADENLDTKDVYRLCGENHVHGVFAPDLLVKDAPTVAATAAALDLAFITLVSSGMDDKEVALRSRTADVVYLKIAKGNTAALVKVEQELDTLDKLIGQVRAANPNAIIAGGVGIRRPGQILALRELELDMIVVGSVLMEKMNRSLSDMSDCIDALHRATLSRG